MRHPNRSVSGHRDRPERSPARVTSPASFPVMLIASNYAHRPAMMATPIAVEAKKTAEARPGSNESARLVTIRLRTRACFRRDTPDDIETTWENPESRLISRSKHGRQQQVASEPTIPFKQPSP